jgi:hypothetical protein
VQLSATATRLLAFASLPGGVLLALAWSIPAAFLLPNMFAADVRNVAGPTNDYALLSQWLTLGFAVLYACAAVPAIAKAARVGWPGALGAVLYALGAFFLAVQTVFAITSAATVLPWHWLLMPALLSLGAVLFGLAAFRSGALPRGAALLLAFIQPTALFGVAGPDAGATLFSTDFGLAASTWLRLYGYLGMLGVAAAWVWLGFGIWRRAPAPATSVRTVTA